VSLTSVPIKVSFQQFEEHIINLGGEEVGCGGCCFIGS
jgi:hypothetical protein